jgi:hypothetical protein
VFAPGRFLCTDFAGTGDKVEDSGRDTKWPSVSSGGLDVLADDDDRQEHELKNCWDRRRESNDQFRWILSHPFPGVARRTRGRSLPNVGVDEDKDDLRRY